MDTHLPDVMKVVGDSLMMLMYMFYDETSPGQTGGVLAGFEPLLDN
jgi:hypothetical protein